jgi:leader peptidase (prepilin peptidase) / N-methyltransferase
MPHAILWFSPVAIMLSLGILLVLDSLRTLSMRQLPIWPRLSLKWLAVGATFLTIMAYMVIVPTFFVLVDSLRERPTSITIEDLTWAETFRIRSAKLAVFAIFTYFGASVGSFLNVVATSLPRGESIALRSSACPQCHHPIRRIDNLPIFSYLNLQGRCRDCHAKIPIRYLTVEIIAAGIFASLFLFQLVTGASNIPGFRHYHATGILWMILYTKWDVVGIYFYHAALFCLILTYAITELNRLRMPRWFNSFVLMTFMALPTSIADLQPVSLFSFVSKLDLSLPNGVLMRLTTCLVGGAIGWLFATVIVRAYPKTIQRRSLLPIAMSILGIALGWQAVSTIAFMLILCLFSFAYLRRFLRTPNTLGLTSCFLAVALFHHALWRWLTAFVDQL